MSSVGFVPDTPSLEHLQKLIRVDTGTGKLIVRAFRVLITPQAFATAHLLDVRITPARVLCAIVNYARRRFALAINGGPTVMPCLRLRHFENAELISFYFTDPLEHGLGGSTLMGVEFEDVQLHLRMHAVGRYQSRFEFFDDEGINVPI